MDADSWVAVQHTHVSVHVNTQVSTHVNTHVSTNVNTNVNTYFNAHVSTHVNTHDSTHVDTNVNTHADPWTAEQHSFKHFINKHHLPAATRHNVNMFNVTDCAKLGLSINPHCSFAPIHLTGTALVTQGFTISFWLQRLPGRPNRRWHRANELLSVYSGLSPPQLLFTIQDVYGTDSQQHGWLIDHKHSSIALEFPPADVPPAVGEWVRYAVVFEGLDRDGRYPIHAIHNTKSITAYRSVDDELFGSGSDRQLETCMLHNCRAVHTCCAAGTRCWALRAEGAFSASAAEVRLADDVARAMAGEACWATMLTCICEKCAVQMLSTWADGRRRV